MNMNTTGINFSDVQVIYESRPKTTFNYDITLPNDIPNNATVFLVMYANSVMSGFYTPPKEWKELARSTNLVVHYCNANDLISNVFSIRAYDALRAFVFYVTGLEPISVAENIQLVNVGWGKTVNIPNTGSPATLSIAQGTNQVTTQGSLSNNKLAMVINPTVSSWSMDPIGGIWSITIGLRAKVTDTIKDYTVVGPSTATYTQWSEPFKVIPGLGIIPDDMLVPLSDNGAGGEFNPTSVKPGNTFVYRNNNKGRVTINCGVAPPVQLDVGLPDITQAPLDNILKSLEVFKSYPPYASYYRDIGIFDLAAADHYDIIARILDVQRFSDKNNLGFNLSKQLNASVMRYREQYIGRLLGSSKGYHTHGEGLKKHWMKKLDNRTLDILLVEATRSVYLFSSPPSPTYLSIYSLREMSLALMTLLDAQLFSTKDFTRDIIIYAKSIINAFYDTEIFACGTSAFMYGMAAQALALYWEAFQDPEVIPAIEYMAKWLIQTTWSEPETGFYYIAPANIDLTVRLQPQVVTVSEIVQPYDMKTATQKVRIKENLERSLKWGFIKGGTIRQTGFTIMDDDNGVLTIYGSTTKPALVGDTMYVRTSNGQWDIKRFGDLVYSPTYEGGWIIWSGGKTQIKGSLPDNIPVDEVVHINYGGFLDPRITDSPYDKRILNPLFSIIWGFLYYATGKLEYRIIHDKIYNSFLKMDIQKQASQLIYNSWAGKQYRDWGDKKPTINKNYKVIPPNNLTGRANARSEPFFVELWKWTDTPVIIELGPNYIPSRIKLTSSQTRVPFFYRPPKGSQGPVQVFGGATYNVVGEAPDATGAKIVQISGDLFELRLTPEGAVPKQDVEVFKTVNTKDLGYSTPDLPGFSRVMKYAPLGLIIGHEGKTRFTYTPANPGTYKLEFVGVEPFYYVVPKKTGDIKK